MKNLILGMAALLAAQASFAQEITLDVKESDGIGGVVTPLKDLFGVNGGPQGASGSTGAVIDLTAEFQDMGVTTIRNHDYYDGRLDMGGVFNCSGADHGVCSDGLFPCWSDCLAASAGAHFFGSSDALFGSILAGGFKSFLRVGDSWKDDLGPNPSGGYDFRGPRNSFEEGNWREMALRIVSRYKAWSGSPTLDYVEIFNEPENSAFWSSTGDWRRFIRRVIGSVKSANPTLKIGGPGFEALTTRNHVMTGSGGPAASFLGELWSNGVRPDFISFHFYGTDANDLHKAIDSYRALLDATGPFDDEGWKNTGFFAQTELAITEFGAVRPNGTIDPPDSEVADYHCGSKGAAALTAHYLVIQALGTVSKAFVYKGGQDGSGLSCTGRPNHGLIRPDGPTRRAHAFRLWTEQYRLFPSKLPVPSGHWASGTTLFHLGAKDSSGDASVLIANTSPNPVTFRVRYFNASGTIKPMSAWRSVRVFQVDDTNDGRSPVHSLSYPRIAITIPAHSVQLVTLRN